MSVTVSLESAEHMTRLLESHANGTRICESDILEVIDGTEGYRRLFERFPSARGTYLTLLKGVLFGGEVETDVYMSRSLDGYKMMLSQLPELRRKLEFTRSFDFAESEALALEHLPGNLSLNVDLLCVLDPWGGGNQVLDRNCFTLDVWQMVPQWPEAILYGIAHELHHIGAWHLQKTDLKRVDLLAREDHIGLAVKLVESVLGEGGAVHFFDNQKDRKKEMEVFTELYGEQAAIQVAMVMEESVKDMPEKLRGFECLLVRLLRGDGEYREMRGMVGTWTMGQGNRLPLDKVVGAEMVATIEAGLGKDAAIGCFVRLRDFLPLYNTAAKLLGKPLFSDTFMHTWMSLWS